MRLCGLFIAIGMFCAGAAYSDEVETVFRQDFETAPEAKQWTGTYDTEKAFAGTKGAFKAKVLPDNQWFGGDIAFSGNNTVLFKTTDKTMFNFCYFTTEPTTVKITLAVDDATIKFIAYPIEKPTVNEWTVASIKMTDFKDGFGYGKKVAAGLGVKSMSFNFGKPKSDKPHWLDNIVVTEGALPGDLDTFVKEGAAAAKAKAERMAAEKAAQTLTLADNQALLSPDMLAGLKRGWKKEDVTVHTIMVVGADAAKALDHWSPLLKNDLKDCKIVDKFSSTLPNGDMEKIKARALEALKKFKPEIVTILPGTTDFAVNKTAAEVATSISGLADAVIEAGAIPILYTPAVANRGLPVAVQAYKDLTNEVRKLAANRKLPLVDANAIINPDGATKMSFVSGTAPNTAGHDAINKVSLLLYTRLEEYLFERKDKDVPGAPKEAKKTDAGKKAGKVQDEE